MKYTRYDYNKKKKSNFGISLIIIIILGTLIGAAVSKLSHKSMKNIINSEKGEVQTSSTKNEIVTTINNYTAIQCGVYQNIDNANAVLASIPTNYNAFIIEEEGKYKVIAGIFDENIAESKVNELNSASINNFSIKFNINEKDNNDLLISEIIKSYLQIINKVADQNTESINTSEFKNWIEKVTSKNEDETIKKIVNMTENLPEELKKENNVEVLKNLYNLLSKYKV